MDEILGFLVGSLFGFVSCWLLYSTPSEDEAMMRRLYREYRIWLRTRER